MKGKKVQKIQVLNLKKAMEILMRNHHQDVIKNVEKILLLMKGKNCILKWWSME